MKKLNWGLVKVFCIFIVIIGVCVLFALLLKNYEGFGNNKNDNCNEDYEIIPIDQFYTRKGAIFVSIASYRDTECSSTVSSIYKNARYPENIFLGICEQNKDPDEKCFDPAVEKYKNNIRYNNIPWNEAKGPSYARYLCSRLWQGEQYFLQIDSHTFFEKDWDITLINMLEACRYKNSPETDQYWGMKGSHKPVLSAYPPTEDQLKLTGYVSMDSFRIGNSGIPMFGSSFIQEKLDKPPKSPKPFYAAGFMFLDGIFLYDVPYDPSLSHLFQGEEVLFSARMFTNGYDLFNPNILTCSHHYNRKGSLYWNDIKDHSKCREQSEKKVMNLLKGLDESYPFGFGDERSLDDFWKVSGIKL